METGSQLVVIGSSAGGIEALSRVVASLPADFSAPIVIAQHLDPRRPSHLAEILGRHSPLPIRVVDETSAIEDGVVYVVPSNRVIEVVDGALRVRRGKPGVIAPSIDLLLTTAARSFGERLIAVILTGTGSDGSAGAWQVKRAGGTVVIENPETAMFPSMPGSISPSLVDARADLDSIGDVLVGLLRVVAVTPTGQADDAFGLLLERIRERSGIDFSAYKSATIARRLAGRMSATDSGSIEEYAALTERDSAEYDRLVGSLLIKVTEFFRDPKLWDHLRDQVLPGLIDEARREGRELRGWSAGCSSGEEPYSIGILMHKHAAERRESARLETVKILGTDIDADCIGEAERAFYADTALGETPPALRQQYFPQIAGLHGMLPEVRRLASFECNDLLAYEPPLQDVHLILCRNVIIYFEREAQDALFSAFHRTLAPGGFLVLGKVETLLGDARALFTPVNARERIFRKA